VTFPSNPNSNDQIFLSIFPGKVVLVFSSKREQEREGRGETRVGLGRDL